MNKLINKFMIVSKTTIHVTIIMVIFSINICLYEYIYITYWWTTVFFYVSYLEKWEMHCLHNTN